MRVRSFSRRENSVTEERRPWRADNREAFFRGVGGAGPAASPVFRIQPANFGQRVARDVIGILEEATTFSIEDGDIPTAAGNGRPSLA